MPSTPVVDRQELRRALRRLARDPGFTMLTVLTVALGIGAATAVFSVVDGVLLDPLPYDDPDRIVTVAHTAPGLDLPLIPSATGAHVVYDEGSDSFRQLALYGEREVTITTGGEPRRTGGAAVTPSLFRVLRAEPALGRVFTEEEGVPGTPETVVLGHGLWVDRFGADPAAVGRSLELDGEVLEIVGVMPPDFAFPDRDSRFWVPLQIDRSQGTTFGGFNYLGLGRLREGVTAEAAREELAVLLPRVADRYDNLTDELLEDARIAPVVRPFLDDLVGEVRPALWILLATVGFVLLIACANVANLTLVRAEGRGREVAVRRALGADRRHLAAQFLTESSLLVAAGSLLGLLVAWQGVGLLKAASPEGLPRLDAIDLDASVLLVAAALTASVALAFGLIPVLRHRRGDAADTLRGARGSTADRARHRARRLLVVSQVAFALVLLAGSGLMIRSFAELLAVDPGFEPANVLTFRVGLPTPRYPEPADLAAFHRSFLQQIESLPGVESAAAVSQAPLGGLSNMGPYTARDRLAESGENRPFVQTRAVTPGYFDALGIPLLRGRELRWSDVDRRASTAMISERARELFLEGLDPLGRRIGQGVLQSDDGDWVEVVGVVDDVRYVSLTREPTGTVYLPILLRESSAWMARTVDYVVRASVPPTSIAPAVRSALRRLDSEIPLADVRTMAQVARDASARHAFTLVLLIIGASAGLFLGVVGLYGVISYLTARRRREIGVRVALGASPSSVRAMVMRQGLSLTAVGILLGLAAAWGLTRFMAALLVEVSARDPLTFASVTGLLVVVSAVAVWVPARRASRADPMEALRAE